jgi:uncharacterized membrane protein YeaQ/YmgE (transglycosylase-associated protein family)
VDILIFLIVGLIAGVLAKAIMPGTANEPGGWLLTMVLGVAGAFLGGFIGRAFGANSAGAAGSFSFMGILWSVIGAIVIIALARLFTGRRAV